MNHGLSDQVRSVALEKYVQPALVAGKTRLSIAVRDLMRDLRIQGFPERNWPQVCSAIQAEKFLRANGLEIEGVDGPPSKKSTTVVIRYRVSPKAGQSATDIGSALGGQPATGNETPEERAHRLTGKLFGLLKDELAEYGGADAFLKWVRSDEEMAS